MKKIRSIIISIFISLSISGCGEIRSVGELNNYANERFGNAEMISFEENEEYTLCYFTDRNFGFSYSVTSAMRDFGIDGSTAFTYEQVSTDYYSAFYSYVEPDLLTYFSEHENDLEDYGIVIRYDGNVEDYMRRADLVMIENVSEVNLEIAQTFAEDYISYFKKLDTKHVFKTVDVLIGVTADGKTTYQSYDGTES